MKLPKHKSTIKRFLAFLAIFLVLVSITHLASMRYFASHPSTLTKADLIMVFPGDNDRISAAFALAEKGWGKKMAIIGRTPKYLKKRAKNYTVPPETTFIGAGKSHSTFEDVYRTHQIISQNNIDSIILVTSAYHMPRALVLLKTFLFTSGIQLEIQTAPVNSAAGHYFSKTLKLYYNECIEIWGSLAEMTLYRCTGTLSSQIPNLNTIKKFFHTYLLFDI